MQRAGLAVARLALAVAPHAKTIWIACGPGNNGGDGFEAAMHLRAWGKDPVVTWSGDEARAPADALASLHRAQALNVRVLRPDPAAVGPGHRCHAGPGRARGRWKACWPNGPVRMAAAGDRPVLAVDLPSGLNARHRHRAGRARQPHAQPVDAEARTLHRRRAGTRPAQVWFDDLGCGGPMPAPTAWLAGAAAAPAPGCMPRTKAAMATWP